MIPSFLRSIWGDLSNEELKKFGILSSIFFLILGAYYILKTSKDGVLVVMLVLLISQSQK